MKSILIISTTYAQLQQIRTLLLQYPEQYQIAGTADNSVLGMSMIESLRPDVVIMPTYMNFWNAEDLINYLLPRGIAPQFILMQDEAELPLGGAAATQVAALLPESPPTGAQLLAALQAAERYQERSRRAAGEPCSYHPAIQHSLEVMELLMGLTPLRTGAAQMEFGRLRVGREDCWLLLCAPARAEEAQFNFFAQFENLEQIFERLSRFLEPLGRSEICIYRESNLCILLAGGQREEPAWDMLARSLNRFLSPFGVPELLFEISDFPLPLERWHSQCRELLELRQARFFHSPPYLQPKLVRAYRADVTQAQIHDKLSALSLALQNRLRTELVATLQALEELVSHSLSGELYAFVSTQLVVLYSRLRYSYGIQTAEDASCSLQFSSVSAAFQAYRTLFLDLFDQLEPTRGGSNQLVTEVCSYIRQNLGETLSLEVLSRHVHVSPTYLSRLFKRETGCALNAYISQHRVLRAMQLLETHYKIIDIAGMVGFENAKYFSQVFRRQVGKTPQQYRLELRKEEPL